MFKRGLAKIIEGAYGMKVALLLGNGLNRLAGKMDFRSLLVKALLPNQDPYYKVLSSYSLEFERIYSDRNINPKDRQVCSKYDLKKEIKKELKDVKILDGELPLLKEFMSLPIKHIMTTNYDYNLERSVNPSFDREKSPGKTKEKLYSLHRSLIPNYRSLQEADKVVWHIHGEAEAPNSICLDFEHYCAQLAAMRQFLISMPKEDSKQIEDNKDIYLTHFLRNGGLKPQSWLPLFFTHDVYIIGLCLSFMEIDLWWLLTYRYQYQLTHPEAPKNKIIFFYRPKAEKKISEEFQLMPSLGVKLKALGAVNGDYPTFYDLALAELTCSLI